MRRLAKTAFCVLYKYTGALSAQESISRWAGRAILPILLFHRVTDAIPEDGLTVSTSWFRDCCKMLQRNFRVVSLAEVYSLLERREAPPRRTVAITFDDCYRDNLFAARTLADYGLPATFFLPTKYIGTDHTFPWDRNLHPMPNLSWDDVTDMARMGHDIGSHTVTHADLGQIDDDTARNELTDSKKALEQHLGRPVRWFAYPFGGRHNFKPDRLQLVRAAGYDACFSGFGGFVTPGMHGQVLPRESVPYFRSVLNLELHLTGCLDWVYALKRQVGLISA